MAKIKVLTPYRSLVIIMFVCGALLLVSWTVVGIFTYTLFLGKNSSDVSGYYMNHADLNKLPRLSADKKTLVVLSEDALPNAFEFLRLNMYLPIQKIVLMKPGANDTVRVYPIPREGIIGLRPNYSVSLSDIALITIFLVFIILTFTYIFSNISSTKALWDEENWLQGDDLSVCFEANDDLSSDEEMENEKLLQKAEVKRKEIEST